MRKLGDRLPANNEVGAMLCRRRDGSTVMGPRAQGTHDRVDVPYSCPPGSDPYGVWHTHPHGIAEPSPDDIRAATAFGLRRLCVTVPETGETKCTNL
jgi:proteasome lid subunit RPN8/RPN11